MPYPLYDIATSRPKVVQEGQRALNDVPVPGAAQLYRE